ncbi:MAG: DUF1015 domain-containing protein [Candidatus Omnitrophica bacterium]|nr:DUF1015 domain-containing protein [Candidatus Omnitrophota bacterium]
MPTIRAFKGVIYNAKKAGDISRVVAPPYDVIPSKMQEDLYRAHPNNIVRLILGRIEAGDDTTNNRYTRARDFYDSWLKDRVLVRDTADSFYVYSQAYKDASGKNIERTGFIGLMRLDTGGKRTVLPHENTLAAPKVDRISLMRSVKANLSPIFVLYDDEQERVMKILKKACSKDNLFIDVSFEGVRNRVWRLDGADDIKKIERLMSAKDIFIADGHHRYEVAANYSKEVDEKGADAVLKRNSKFVMVYFVPSAEKTLTVLPTHRAVKDTGNIGKEDIMGRLKKYFDIKKAADIGSSLSGLSRMRGACAFVIYLGKGEFYILRLKDYKISDKSIKGNSRDWKRLDVTILHRFLLERVLGIRDDEENIEFVKEPDEAAHLVDNGGFKAAFLLNPTKVSQIKRIAILGEKMPRKATYFYPKPLSGLVINKLG